MLYEHQLEQPGLSYEWKRSPVECFDELILSWNAYRPKRGHYVLFFCIFSKGEWSPWFPYALWGASAQKSFLDGTNPDLQVKVLTDLVKVEKGEGFSIRVVAEEGATLDNFYSLNVWTSGGEPSPSRSLSQTIHLDVPLISQMALKHPRAHHLCSPTSTAAVIRYFKRASRMNPLAFASNVWDGEANIFGNWPLNCAQVYSELGGQYKCCVVKMENFSDLYAQLEKGMPSVISVRGPLVGGAAPYQEGHLMVVKGFDAEKKEVLCMDPAFPTDAETSVRYSLEDFISAWSRRGRIAYLFNRR